MTSRTHPPRLGITLGDPAGIGPEIVLKALKGLDSALLKGITLFGDSVALQAAEAQTGLRLPRGIVLKEPGVLNQPPAMGVINAQCGESAHASLCLAVEAAGRGEVDALVTGPIHKAAFRAGGSADLDHTAVLKRLTRADDATTVFVLEQLRVFFLTRHLALRDVADAVTPPLLEAGIRQNLRYLRLMGVEKPLLAVAALNPHGGDGGLIGREDDEVIAPVISRLVDEGLRVTGPVPADSVFHLAKIGRYDGVLSLYHDQGHIAIKTLDFHRTVSLTLGLPFLRTSVDHGTAFDIAGKNSAEASGMVEAILIAAQLAGRFKVR